MQQTRKTVRPQIICNHFQSYSGERIRPSHVQMSDNPVHSGKLCQVFVGELRENDKQPVPIAVKRLQKDSLNLSTVHYDDICKTLASFCHECQLLSDLEHENIVRFYGVSFSGPDDIPMAVMERMERTLRRSIRQYKETVDQGLPLHQVIGSAKQICRAVRYLHLGKAHGHGELVHGDLSSTNILLSADGLCCKIADFGVTRSLEHGGQLRPTGDGHGQSSYIPGNVLLQGAPYDRSLDIYSVGILLLEMCTGVTPDPPRYNQAVPAAAGNQHLASDTDRLRDALSKLPTDHILLRLIGRCIDEPAHRPCIDDLIDALENLKDFQPRLREVEQSIRSCRRKASDDLGILAELETSMTRLRKMKDENKPDASEVGRLEEALAKLEFGGKEYKTTKGSTDKNPSHQIQFGSKWESVTSLALPGQTIVSPCSATVHEGKLTVALQRHHPETGQLHISVYEIGTITEASALPATGLPVMEALDFVCPRFLCQNDGSINLAASSEPRAINGTLAGMSSVDGHLNFCYAIRWKNAPQLVTIVAVKPNDSGLQLLCRYGTRPIGFEILEDKLCLFPHVFATRRLNVMEEDPNRLNMSGIAAVTRRGHSADIVQMVCHHDQFVFLVSGRSPCLTWVNPTWPGEMRELDIPWNREHSNKRLGQLHNCSMVCSPDDRLILAGGCVPYGLTSDSMSEEFVTDVYSYDLSGYSRYTKLPPLHSACDMVMLIFHEGFLYSVGGFNGKSYTADVHRLAAS